MTKRRFFLLFPLFPLCALTFLCWGPFFAPVWSEEPGPLEQQEAMAAEYLFRLARMSGDEPEERERLYLGLTEDCPGTEAAQEAHWALSNLYLDGFDDPKEDKAREILEQFLKRYPSSQWVDHVESRLAWLRSEH
ncbi:MAG: hypothetical protein LBD04_09525 [Synergistaceae bacterium]|jgi:hypothetical protein|nr:hypothetical protein [Synergistaceae bacterium]